MKIAEFLGPDGLIIVSGAIGSIVGAITHDGNTRARIRIAAVGTLSSFYLAPLFIPLISGAFGIIGANIDGAVPLSGFGAGAFGIVIIETIREAIKRRATDIANGKTDLGKEEADRGSGETQ